MIKLIVSDFDGTLRPYGEPQVTSSVKKRIDAALDAGITVAISSGRTLGELVDFLPEYADRVFFICCDGAYYSKNRKTLYERKIEQGDLAKFLEPYVGYSCVLHGAEKNYSFGQLPEEAAHFNAEPISKFGELKEKIFKITTYGREIELPSYSGLRMHWDGGRNASAQLVNRFANKGTALSDLQVRLMLAKFDTACIGDSGNDVAMMKNAKLSFAVGTRSEKLLEAVNQKVDRVEDAFDAILEQKA